MLLSVLLAAVAQENVRGQDQPLGDAARGQTFFQINCAVCHSPVLGPDNTVIMKQGPSLIGVVGRPSGSLPYFSYTKAIRESGFTWDPANLYQFLANPMVVVPGTTMPIPVTAPRNRADVIAYLGTLKIPEGVALKYEALPETAGGTDPNDWQRQAPGAQHHFKVADLPEPFATRSAGNPPQVVPAPTNATLAVPPGFAVKLFAKGLQNPRLVRTAPNGDIFIAETARDRIRVLRAADGADAPTENQIFAEGLRGPFGISFYPAGDKPQWIYVANNNSVVRIPYRRGDLKASGEPEVIVPKLTDSTGGHSTRDVVFSKDGKRMFISVGSGSNVAEQMSKKTPEEIRAWEVENGAGAAWGPEWHRAEILWTDPEGRQPLHAFATGVRNGVGLAVNPETGDLWVSTNGPTATAGRAGRPPGAGLRHSREGGRLLWVAVVLYREPRGPETCGRTTGPGRQGDCARRARSIAFGVAADDLLHVDFRIGGIPGGLPGRRICIAPRFLEPHHSHWLQGHPRAAEPRRTNRAV